MRSSFLVYLLFLAVVLIITPCSVTAKRSGVDLTSEEVDESDGYIVQINPDYDDDDDDDDKDNDEESEEEEEDADDDASDVDNVKEKKKAKSALAKALSKTRNSPKNALKMLKKNKTKIVVALALFAFRKEVAKAVVHILGTPIVDPETGKVVGRVIRIQPTNIIKILVFLDVMMKVMKLTGNAGDDGSQSSLPLAAALLGGPNSLLFSQLISSLLMPSNTAYVPPIEQHYTFERINERYSKDSMALSKAMSTPTQTQIKMPKSLMGDFNKNRTEQGSKERQTSYNGTSIILELKGLDTMVAQAHDLNDKVSFLLEEHRAKKTSSNATTLNSTDATEENELEVIILLESPGGSAAEYGLAAQQILRLRDEPGINVTIIVDKVAASGGYMMACTSSPGRLYAAPFAVVGSIGVIGQTVNIHSALENWGVKPLVFRGGKHKAPVGLIGEVSDEGIKTIQTMIDKTHNAFKKHVLTARPKLAKQIDDVATGDVWLGCDALDVGLIDRIITSDEYIQQRLRNGVRVLKLINYDKRRFPFAGIHPQRTVAKLFADASNILSKVSNLLSSQVSVAGTDSVDIQASARSFTTKLQSNVQCST